MTAEPKFVPEEAAEIALPEGGACRVRLVDCVGYLVEAHSAAWREIHRAWYLHRGRRNP